MATTDDRALVQRQYFSPLETVKNFFEALDELRTTSGNATTSSKRFVYVRIFLMCVRIVSAYIRTVDRKLSPFFS